MLSNAVYLIFHCDYILIIIIGHVMSLCSLFNNTCCYCYTVLMAAEEETPKLPLAHFAFPQIQDNPYGWGPLEVPEQFKDTPYQPFCKNDRLGKVNVVK